VARTAMKLRRESLLLSLRTALAALVLSLPVLIAASRDAGLSVSGFLPAVAATLLVDLRLGKTAGDAFWFSVGCVTGAFFSALTLSILAGFGAETNAVALGVLLTAWCFFYNCLRLHTLMVRLAIVVTVLLLLRSKIEERAPSWALCMGLALEGCWGALVAVVFARYVNLQTARRELRNALVNDCVPKIVTLYVSATRQWIAAEAGRRTEEEKLTIEREPQLTSGTAQQLELAAAAGLARVRELAAEMAWEPGWLEVAPPMLSDPAKVLAFTEKLESMLACVASMRRAHEVGTTREYGARILGPLCVPLLNASNVVFANVQRLLQLLRSSSAPVGPLLSPPWEQLQQAVEMVDGQFSVLRRQYLYAEQAEYPGNDYMTNLHFLLHWRLFAYTLAGASVAAYPNNQVNFVASQLTGHVPPMTYGKPLCGSKMRVRSCFFSREDLRNFQFRVAGKRALALLCASLITLLPAVRETFRETDDSLRPFADNSAWAPVTVALVMEGNVGASYHKALNRVLGTLFAALVNFPLLAALGLNPYLAAVQVFVFVFAFSLLREFRFWNYLGIMGALTTCIFVIGAYDRSMSADHTQLFVLSRIAQTLIGVFIAIVFNLLVWPLHAEEQLRLSVANTVGRCSNLMRSIISAQHDAFGQPDPQSFLKERHAEICTLENKIRDRLSRHQTLLQETRVENYLCGRCRPFPSERYADMVHRCNDLLSACASMRKAIAVLNQEGKDTLDVRFYESILRPVELPIDHVRDNVVLLSQRIILALFTRSAIPATQQTESAQALTQDLERAFGNVINNWLAMCRRLASPGADPNMLRLSDALSIGGLLFQMREYCRVLVALGGSVMDVMYETSSSRRDRNAALLQEEMDSLSWH
jgi:hypothetical protein